MADNNIISALNIGGNKYEIHSTSAIDADKLDGLHASTFARASDVTTLQGYFNNGSAKSAEKATSAEKAASAGKLSAAQIIQATGDVSWSASFDGSSSATGAATIKSVPASAISAVPYSAISAHGKSSLTPNSASTTTGYASAAAVEKALATLQSEIGQIAAFDGPYTSSGSIPTPYKTNTIYLVGPAGVEPDSYQEYISTDGAALTMIGDTSIDMSQYQTTAGMTAYVQKADISAASAKWNGASAFAASASGNYSTISGYATDWNTNKTAVSGAATSGAAASAWISSHSANLDNTIAAVTGAVTTSAGMTAAANTGKLATVGAITGYVEEQLDETIDIAEEISDANASKIPYVSAVKNYVDNFSGNYVEYTDTAKSATIIYTENKAYPSFIGTSGNTFITSAAGGDSSHYTKISGDVIQFENPSRGLSTSSRISSNGFTVYDSGYRSASYTQADAVVGTTAGSASLTSVYTTVSGNSGSWANQNAYGIIKVENSAGVLSTTTANTSQDTMYFKAGTNIDLVATGTDGHPTIEINAKESYVSAGVAYIF